jgi:hypothetical protein
MPFTSAKFLPSYGVIYAYEPLNVLKKASYEIVGGSVYGFCGLTWVLIGKTAAPPFLHQLEHAYPYYNFAKLYDII